MLHATPRLCARGNSIGRTIGAVALLALGCAGQSLGDSPAPVIEPSVTEPSVTDRPAIDERVTTARGDQVPIEIPLDAERDAAEACLQSPQGRRAGASETEFREMLVGNWLLCASPSVFGTTGEAGLAIYDDLRWAKLTRGDDGQLRPTVGWDREGSWESVDTSDMNGPGVYQLNLSVDGSGTVITIPIFAEQPAVVRLNNNGVFVADYAKL